MPTPDNVDTIEISRTDWDAAVKHVLIALAPRFASIAAKIIAKRLNVELARVSDALAGALVEIDHKERNVEDKKPARNRARAGARVSARVVRVQPRAKRARAGKGDRAPAANRTVAAKPSSPSPAPKKRAQMKCGKCGAPGFRKDGCGTSHQPMNQQPLVVDEERFLASTRGDRDLKPANIPSPPPYSKSDRFARIEAAAAARRGASQ